MNIDEILGDDRVLPVLAFDSVSDALAVGRTLVASGIRLLEVTLRTRAALDCIRALSEALPQACVGVGTVLEPAQVVAARDAGAVFGVSPGLTPALTEALCNHDFPFIPGVATVSEIMTARTLGFRVQKFFPAEAAGGTRFLRSLQDVVPDVCFCATGGINPESAASYLALTNVRAIGGSWMIRHNSRGQIDLEHTRRAAQACMLL